MAHGGLTRRLTTIVAVDVAGYSRLIGVDEEATLAALRAHRIDLIDPKIAEYKGRIANTAGDSILFEFPSVVEALRCAMDIQRGMSDRNRETPEDRQIAFRVGINVGDVVEQDNDLLGYGVNVAARLEGLAEPGGICLSRTARDQVRDHLEITLEDLGEVEVKNIARPVSVFRVLGEGETATPQPPVINNRWPLLAIIITAPVLIIAVGLLWWRPWVPDLEPASVSKMAFKLPDRPSIAVLPFTNMSRDKVQDYFADGIT
jgi:adenylate cyclase